MNKLYIALVAVFFSAVMSGCSTVEGFGKDLKKGGEAIEEASKK
ncbi:entericidin A/B family lipoprotein [Neptunomonas antarctica]|uniref:Predicted small secreted protein n=1 Tax=Neptunomonas antarctica TaxID=619304 RepID=A0A1N7M4M6_9GAMM|nr:entericidin A/B family lipoprotein [Neptunomonas antarctica]SIS80901.1 Predicted small secreted protein [Neptunomonas antarctica]